MTKKPNNTQIETEIDPSSKIETIRNLLFGESIQQYDTELESIKNEITNKKDVLQSYIDDVRGELMQSIDSLSTDVNIRITDLEDALTEKTQTLTKQKVDKKELGKLLVALGEKISE